MSNKILVRLLTILLIVSACKNSNNIFGIYQNKYESNTIHYIKLNENKEYYHYYKKENEQAKINIGNWIISKKNNEIELRFENWIDYGFIEGVRCNQCLKYVKLVHGELIFSIDMSSEMNFIKDADN